MMLYAVTIFLSAFLLFQVQPLIAKVILPWFGGSAAVWTICMLFFQVLLLAGYVYSHAYVRLRISARRHIHIALLALAVAADITSEQGRIAALAACPQPDILVTNAGGPPPGDFRKFSREDWLKAVGANMITPIELIKATVDGMIARRFGRILNITSSAVKAPIAELALSNGARSGLTGFVAGLARATVAHNVTINNLLPGRFWTDRLKSNTEFTAKEKGKTVEEVRRDIEKAIPAGRFGTPEEFGELCAYLCSIQAGYITGQNFLIDGGIYPGTF